MPFDDSRGSIETRGRDSARWIKTISALLMIGGILVAVAGYGIGGALLFIGFIGFIIGRFME